MLRRRRHLRGRRGVILRSGRSVERGQSELSRSQEAETRVRSVEHLRRKQLLQNPRLGLDMQESCRLMGIYQRSVVAVMRDALLMTDPQAGQRAVKLERALDWSQPSPLSTCMSTRGKASALAATVETVTVEKASPAMLSEILAQMRRDSFRSGVGTRPKRVATGDFATFFFLARSIFGAACTGRLYAITAATAAAAAAPRKGASGPAAGSRAVVGFAIATMERGERAKRRRPGGKRRRLAEAHELWIDLFEVFADFRRLGLGTQAVPLLIQAVIIQHPQTCPRFVRLHPLHSAEKFWRSCGFRWSSPTKNDGHLVLKIHSHVEPPESPSPRKRPRLH
jgi:hypothetical protein